MKKKLSTRGQSLIEMLIALTVVVVVIIALLSVTTGAIRNASFARNQAQATQYAQEGIERMRIYRDADWAIFAASCADNMVVPGLPSPPSPFEMAIRCSDKDGSKEVTVTVFWTDSKGIHKSEITTRLSNWQ